MIVSIHQPAYLPWMGYLARIAASDIFIYLDTVQFEKNSFTNRNRVKTANGPIWLTVPVQQQGHIGKPMTELLVDPRQVLRASSLPVEGSKSELVLALCRHVGATEYISGPLGRGYLQEDDFGTAGIAVHYQQFAHPRYPQLYGEFEPAMGIVDYWMNVDQPDQFTDIVKVNA
jgi:hypothetical protein